MNYELKKDNAFVRQMAREFELELKRCPICGAKAFISHNTVDGFDMGWSAGCPRYRIGDDIHGVNTYTENDKKRYTVFNMPTKEKAIEAWNRRVNDEADKK